MTAKKIALFIDADNVSAKFGKKIIEALEKRGELFIRRIYGNWEKFSLHGWNDCILNHSLRAVQQPDFVTGKNATDMSLTIDAMDVLHEGKAEIFALVSNDSDFTPLVIRLREGGMFIIGIGNANASNAFRAACSEFIDLNSLAEVKQPPVKKITPVEKVPSPPAKITPLPAEKISPAPEKKSSVQLSLFDAENNNALKQPKISNPKVVPITTKKNLAADSRLQKLHDVLRETVSLRGDDKGFVALCWAGQSIREKNLGFGVKDLGFGSLHAFVSAFPNLYEVINRDNGENFCYRCRNYVPPKKISAPVNNDKIKQFHDALREAATASADDKGFANLCSVGAYVTKKKLGFGVKNFGYSTLQKFIADFPDRYEVRKVANKIFLRCYVDDKPKNVQPADDRIAKLHEVLHATATLRADESGFADLSYAGNSIGKQKIGFGIRSLGYSTLQKFVADFPDRYEMKKVSHKVFYRCRVEDVQSVDKPEELQLPADDKTNQLHKLLQDAAKNFSDDDGFVNLLRACDYILIKENVNREIKEMTYPQLSDFLADFPDLYEVRNTGNDIFYRCCELQISAEEKLNRLHDILLTAEKVYADNKGFVSMWDLCKYISEKISDRELRELSYKDLFEFVAEFPDRYEVIEPDKNVFCYRRRTAEQKVSDDDKLNRLHEVLRESAKAHGDAAGFSLLNHAGNALKSKKLGYGIKDFGYHQLRDFVADFPDLYETTQDQAGKNFRYRCKQSQKL